MNSAANTDSPPAARRFGRAWIWIPALVAVLLLALLVFMPYAISWAMKDWLLANGAGSVEIGDVDFNPFTGTAAVDLLNVRVSDRQTLAIPRLGLEVDWSPLFSRRLRVKSVIVDGLNLIIEKTPDGALSVGGVRLPEGGTAEEAPGKPWGYGILSLGIRDTVIEYRTPEMVLKTAIDELELSDLATWADAPAALRFRGMLNDAPVELDGELPPLSTGYGYNGRIRVGGLPLAGFAAFAEPAVAGLAGRLTVDSGLNARQLHDQPLEVSQEGLVRVEGLQLAQAENAIRNEQLQWQGKLDITLADAVAITTRGVISGESLDLELPVQGINLSQGKFTWNGSVDYSEAEADGLQVAGKVLLEKTRVVPRDGDILLLRFAALDLGSLKLQGMNRITLEDLAIKDTSFAESQGSGEAAEGDQEPPPLTIASLNVDHVEVTDGKRISIDNILSDHATYIARRNPGGEWRMATILGSLPFGAAGKAADKPSPAPEQSAPEQSAPEQSVPEQSVPEQSVPEQPVAQTPGGIRVGEVKNTNATLTLEDNSVSPPFRMRFDMQAVIRDVDSARPDQDTHVYLKGSLAKHNRIEIEGTMRPFLTPPAVNMKMDIKGLELPPLSPYAIASIGHRLESGQLDADSTLRLEKGQLDGANKLVLRGLKLSPVQGEQLNKMQGSLAVPLDKALDMLRDDNDVIRLKLPIKGDLDSPDFDPSDAINQAVAKAAKEGAITTLTLLLQPYGSLITVARYAADKASEIRLAPVVFAPASATIDPARHDYLDKVAGIIAERPNVNIRVCGVATTADRTALQEQALAAAQAQKQGKDSKADKAEQKVPAVSDVQLVDLADLRDDAVKDYLVDRHGVDAGRLVACQPMIDAKEGAEPRVDLLI